MSSSVTSPRADNCNAQVIKSLHYSSGMTPKRITSGGVHLGCLAPGQHSCEETMQR